jgi:demethylmenaquinone methyltransferase / 2-methoxy-6-polyprenyl-1,4-benzoquinol methylase
MAPYDSNETARRFFHGTSLSYDHISSICTFGADRWWKRKMLVKIPPDSASIMDQACGTGILSIRIARRFPRSLVVGVDMTDEYLDIARKKIKALNLTNIEFLWGRAEEVVPKRIFDCVTSSYLAKYADLERLVVGVRGMLRPGGCLIMHDFTYPRLRALARLWEFYFTLLQTVGSRLYPEWRSAFEGLPELMRRTRWVEQLEGQLRKNGFIGINTEYLTIGTSAIVTATKGPMA